MISDQYVAKFLVEAEKLEVTTSDGRQWLLRQPRPDESADGDSAYRLMYQRVLDDRRLAELATDQAALEQEARIRGTAGEAAYMLPLLLETAEGVPAYNPADPESLTEFEGLPAEVIADLSAAYLELANAVAQAKKK